MYFNSINYNNLVSESGIISYDESLAESALDFESIKVDGMPLGSIKKQLEDKAYNKSWLSSKVSKLRGIYHTMMSRYGEEQDPKKRNIFKTIGNKILHLIDWVLKLIQKAASGHREGYNDSLTREYRFKTRAEIDNEINDDSKAAAIYHYKKKKDKYEKDMEKLKKESIRADFS